MRDEHEAPIWQATESFGGVFNEVESRIWVIAFVGILGYVQMYIAGETLSDSAVAALQEPIVFGQPIHGLLGTLFIVYAITPFLKVGLIATIKTVRNRA